MTALNYAAQTGSLQCIHVLIENGHADCNAVSQVCIMLQLVITIRLGTHRYVMHVLPICQKL